MQAMQRAVLKIIKKEVGNMVFLFSLLVCTAWELIAFVWQSKLSVGIRVFKGINLPAVGHSVLFLDLFSLRLQFLCSRCGSVNSFFLASASLCRPVPTCLLIPAAVLCWGEE